VDDHEVDPGQDVEGAERVERTGGEGKQHLQAAGGGMPGVGADEAVPSNPALLEQAGSNQALHFALRRGGGETTDPSQLGYRQGIVGTIHEEGAENHPLCSGPEDGKQFYS
jgi:hypothetical protein